MDVSGWGATWLLRGQLAGRRLFANSKLSKKHYRLREKGIRKLTAGYSTGRVGRVSPDGSESHAFAVGWLAVRTESRRNPGTGVHRKGSR
jgi:hypothetical protein